MKSRSREIQVFSMSFLDVLSCALGGVLILLFTIPPPPLTPPEPPPEQAPPSPEPEPEQGYLVPIVFAARMDWDRPVDIDLWIKDPDTAQRNTYVYHLKPRSKVGFLMRDARSATDRQWEIYCTVDPYPGVYEIYAHYYTSSSEPAQISLTVELYPGRPNQGQPFQSHTTLTHSQHSREPGKLLGKFELKRIDQDNYQLDQILP